MTPRTILHLIDSDTLGGAERQVMTLIEHLDRDRWEPVLVHHGSPGIAPLVAEAHAAGVGDWQIPQMPDGLGGAARLPALRRELRRRRPAVVHAHLTWPLAMKWPLAAALAAGVEATVATVQLYLPFHINRRILWQQGHLARRIGRYIAVSQSVADLCAATCGWPESKLTVVHNGIDPGPWERADPEAGREALGAEPGLPVVFTAARLDHQKGLEVLVDAAAQLPGMRFVVAGEGPERSMLEARIAALGLGDRFVLLGRREDVHELMAGCDLFVLPSRYEGLPVSVVEAMAAARPVVATAIGGTDEIVDDGRTGLLVPADDRGALAAAIRQALGDPARAAAFGACGRERVQRSFSATAMAAGVSDVYEELLGTQGRSPR